MLPPKPLKDENNYDISDLNSGGDTDDDEAPRKPVPRWAAGSEFKSSLLRQAYNPPDVDFIFAVQPVEVGKLSRRAKLNLHKKINEMASQISLGYW
jgi:inner centromere protein